MTIVLNEHEWARDMIESRSLGKKPFETLSRVAKYYLDNDYKKRDVRRMLDAFLIQCDPLASLPKWSNTIDCALERALKYDAIRVDFIEITDPEIKTIDSLEGKQVRRLAFTLLCLAKYWDVVNPNGNHWVNSKDCDIMRMANINTSIKRQSLMYHILGDKGLIQFSKKVDNTNVRIKFIQDGPTAVRIYDFRNLGYQYLMYHGEPYFECKNCGVTTKYDDPHNRNSVAKQKYCRSCAAEINIQKTVNSVMKKRENKNATSI